MKNKYDLKITSDKFRSVHPARPCVYGCGLEALCIEKDVGSAEHSMKGRFSVTVGLDLYLSLYASLCNGWLHSAPTCDC